MALQWDVAQTIVRRITGSRRPLNATLNGRLRGAFHHQWQPVGIQYGRRFRRSLLIRGAWTVVLSSIITVDRVTSPGIRWGTKRALTTAKVSRGPPNILTPRHRMMPNNWSLTPSRCRRYAVRRVGSTSPMLAGILPSQAISLR